MTDRLAREACSDQDIDRWNSVADSYAEGVGQPDCSFFRRAEPTFASAIGNAAGKRILDVAAAMAG